MRVSGRAPDREYEDDRPQESDGEVKAERAQLKLECDESEGVNADGETEKSGRKIPDRFEPALSPAGARPDLDGVEHQPVRFHHVGDRLLEVGQHQVEDEDQNLALAITLELAIDYPIGKVRPKTEGRNEGHGTEHSDRGHATAFGGRERGERVGLRAHLLQGEGCGHGRRL